MVASQVEVMSLKAGKKEAYKWVSNGVDSFSIAKAEQEQQGTTIVLYLKEDSHDYLTPLRLKTQDIGREVFGAHCFSYCA